MVALIPAKLVYFLELLPVPRNKYTLMNNDCLTEFVILLASNQVYKKHKNSCLYQRCQIIGDLLC